MARRRTSQIRAIICMFMAMNDVTELAKSHRKSRTARDSNVVPPMPKKRRFGSGATVSAGCATLESAEPEASLTNEPSLSTYEVKKAFEEVYARSRASVNLREMCEWHPHTSQKGHDPCLSATPVYDDAYDVQIALVKAAIDVG